MVATQLPTPQDQPAADVVIFDGECSFCRQQVERLHRWDTGGRLAFLSLHDPAVSEVAPHLTREQLLEEMYVVDRKGRSLGGAAAFRYLTSRLPRLWPLWPLLHVPFSLPVWQFLYRQVANRRYRISNTHACENGKCHVHHR
jgi:predicted DCC family thiol-disulfide oxidoreductase YuxK